MAEALKILPYYTYEDYVHWEGRWEVIDGVPYAMSPLPLPKHQRIATNLTAEFTFQLKECNRCTVFQPIDYLTKEDTILQPDMLIVCDEIKKKYLDFPPALVVEILSPSTALKDRHTKYHIYESQGIKYYLIISPATEEVEIYKLETGEKPIYILEQKGHDFIYPFSFTGMNTNKDSCNAEIDFKEIW